MKKIAAIFSFLLLLTCGNDDDHNYSARLLLQIENAEHNYISFNASSNTEAPLTIIWSDDDSVDIDNKTGAQDIDPENNESLTVYNLNIGQDYYFRLTSTINDIVYYSEIVHYVPAGAYTVFNFSGSLATATNNERLYLEDAKQTHDGFLVAAHAAIDNIGNDRRSIEIFKLNNNLNVEWRLNINHGGDDEKDTVNGLITLDDDTYILIGTRYFGEYSNIFDAQAQIYAVKIDNSGNIIWEKPINYNNINDYSTHNTFISVHKHTNTLRFMSEVNLMDGSNSFYREFELNENGDILWETIIPNNDQFGMIVYDTNNTGEKYNFKSFYQIAETATVPGKRNILIEKYDLTNNLLWSNIFGDDELQDHFSATLRSLIQLQGRNICLLNINNRPFGHHNISRRRDIGELNHSGSMLWTHPAIGVRDAIIDNENNVVYLTYHNDSAGYLSKINMDYKKILHLNIIPDNFTLEMFTRSRIFQINNEYVIIGTQFADSRLLGFKFSIQEN